METSTRLSASSTCASRRKRDSLVIEILRGRCAKENIDLVAVLEALPEFLLHHLKES
jgi:hypothetical protein